MRKIYLWFIIILSWLLLTSCWSSEERELYNQIENLPLLTKLECDNAHRVFTEIYYSDNKKVCTSNNWFREYSLNEYNWWSRKKFIDAYNKMYAFAKANSEYFVELDELETFKRSYSVNECQKEGTWYVVSDRTNFMALDDGSFLVDCINDNLLTEDWNKTVKTKRIPYAIYKDKDSKIKELLKNRDLLNKEFIKYE